MASEGPNSPGTVEDDAAYGSAAWSNPGNAASSNDSRADTGSSTGTTRYLKATSFGFSIPGGATIDGIVVEIERKQTIFVDPGCHDDRVRIVKGGTVGSTDKASASAWPTSDTYASYGGSSDLWGETWSDSDINASNFGVVLAVALSDGGFTFFGGAEVDHIRITVYYTEGGGFVPFPRPRGMRGGMSAMSGGM